MSKTSYDTEVAALRRAQLSKAYNRAYKELQAQGILGYVSPKFIFVKALSYPTPRFYVTELQMMRLLRRLRNGCDYGVKKPAHKEQYEELYRRYLAAKSLNPMKKDIDIVSEIIHQEAPKLYLELNSAYHIYMYRTRRRNR